VPLDPLHNTQPVGIVPVLPDQIAIKPDGTELESTNSVVAICVVLVPAEAVGAVGVPVKAGEIVLALLLTAVCKALNSTSNSEPLIILAGSPEANESFAKKLVDLV